MEFHKILNLNDYANERKDYDLIFQPMKTQHNNNPGQILWNNIKIKVYFISNMMWEVNKWVVEYIHEKFAEIFEKFQNIFE